MILEFKSKDAEKIYNQRFSSSFCAEVQVKILRKLILMENDVPLKMLYAEEKEDGTYSIKIDNFYELVFRVEKGQYVDIDVVYLPGMKRIITPSVGSIIKEELLDPRDITGQKLSDLSGIPRQSVYDVLKGDRKVTENVSKLLGEFFELPEYFFYNMQGDIDIRFMREGVRAEKELMKKNKATRKK